MKRNVAILAVVGLVCLIVIFWFNRKQNLSAQPETILNTLLDSNATFLPETIAPLQNVASPNDVSISSGSSTASPPSQSPAWFHSLNSRIDFFGKVVDENENPIPSVRVNFGRVDSSPSHYTESTTETDSAGLFSLTGAKGKSLQIKLEKEGYYYSRKSNPLSFEYSNPYDARHHRADPTSPVIFRLKKKGKAEPLIVRSKDTVVPADGSPTEMDLSQGKKVGAGQGNFVVRYTRATLERKYAWHCTIEVPSGGLIEFTNEFDFVAPETGYEPTAEIKVLGASPEWRRDVERNYFLKLNNGNFVRLKFRMVTGATEFFHIEYFLNPSGSHNLEYDEAVQPKPTVHE